MLQRFFASPTDIKALFQEIEQRLDICYVWGFSVPCLDILNIFDSCNEIDCFGYALDSTYWIDIHFRDTTFNLVQNAGGLLFFQRESPTAYLQYSYKNDPRSGVDYERIILPTGSGKAKSKPFLDHQKDNAEKVAKY